ncbi:dihydrofolate reductase family protein [Glycomyces arizonensis]|uniref:dihydrofolate reductase family protein n=1 Tax=Glycomyces arizonensis TaxID=256035 RepID=UPI000417A661|nr:dihydrofolate reductase family protein [Glycomyces arizonensis]
MANTIYNTATSLDGYIADSGNSLEWLFGVEGGHPDDPAAEEGPLDEFGDFMAGVGAVCMGATTYEWIVDHERLVDEPGKWPYEQPTWVFTHRELPLVPGADLRFVSGDVAPVHAEMAEAAGGKDRWIVGGGELVGQFFDAGLLDRIVLSAAPVFLGGGAPLLPRRILSDRLELVEARAAGQFASLTYRVRQA